MPIVTLDSIKNQGGRAESDEDEGGNEYFTGGVGNQGGGSGLAVMAPNEGGDQGDPLRQMMQRIQQDQAARGGPMEASGERRVVAVTVYRNGFVVEDGPLRTLDDPNNQAFMESLSQGYCPEELVENGQAAYVKLESRLQEEYDPNAKRPAAGGRGGVAAPGGFNAFGGAGAAVGEIALSATQQIIPGTQGSGASATEPTGGDVIKVQIKFTDGRKAVAKFEKSSTIRHLIARVEALRPEMGPYLLLSSSRGPPKPIESSQFDENIVEAGLAGSVVTVKEMA